MTEKRMPNVEGAVLAHALKGKAPACQHRWYYTVQEIPLLINCKVICSKVPCHEVSLEGGGGVSR
jgi:hypothetical protein